MKKTVRNVFFYGVCAILLLGVLSQFGIIPFKITYFLSGSMLPTYAPGDLAVVYTGAHIDLKTGDVILFSENGASVIHRVKNIENGQITTQGDANENADLRKIQVVEGKLLFSVPKIGYLFDYFHRFVNSFVKR